MSDWLEEFWGDILSEQPLRIMAAWLTLDGESKVAVLNHLKAMSKDTGWADSQRQAATAALQTITESN
jgi:hypothetical protein